MPSRSKLSKVIATTLYSTLVAVSLCGCGSAVVTERDEMQEGMQPSSEKPVEVPLRPEFVKAMQDREKKRQEFIRLAKDAPAIVDEWKPASSAALPDGVSIVVPDTKISLHLPKNWKTGFNQAPLSNYLLCKPPTRPDRTNPALLVALIKPGAEQQLETAQGLVETIKSLRPTRANWQQSKIEWGKISGHKFARVYWSGDDVGKVTFHFVGFIYATTLELAGKKHLLVLSAQEVEKYSNTTLPLLENEILRTNFN